MLLIKLYNFFRGYLVIEIRGLFQERFFNICMRRSIYLWNVRRVGLLKTSACVGIKQFLQLREIAYKSKCYPHIVAKRGFPFTLRKYRTRYAFALGLLLCMGFIYYMTTFLWSVEINAPVAFDKAQLLQDLQEAGLKVGMPLSKVDTYVIETRLLLVNKNISFATVNMKGTVAYIDILQAAPIPDIVPKDKPCDIVASRYGVIKRINAKKGEQIVEHNDVVSEGQLLVSGTEATPKGIINVHAQAEVIATTWHEKTVQVETETIIRQLTGEKELKFELNLLNTKIKLYLDDSVPYKLYDTIEDEQKLVIGTVTLPLSITKKAHYEATQKKRKFTEEEAIKRALEKLYDELDRETEDALSVTKSHSVDKLDGSIFITATYECEEDIAVKREHVPDTQ